ncbi:hypothetical protein PIB30_088690 [Stylosanthes scabra]|uniref:Uncharacterized protein n=1 Tax=Stylosanthes scabra TaxID=79078 RepID=A0ABU6SVB3_9FABA|nr:hypothetical protein [Stylosanthes scabra]
MERKSPREAKKNKESKESGQKVKNKPNPALTMHPRPRPPLLNGEVSVGGAPARPRWCARATPFCNAQDKDTARSHGGGGAPAGRQQNSLNEGYFWDFTFPGQDPSISQAQFDLYGGGTAETQQAFSHFINFSLREPITNQTLL